jgi:hypothetical protein
MGSNHRPEDYESGDNRRLRPWGADRPGRDVHSVRAVHGVRSIRHGLMGTAMGKPALRRYRRTVSSTLNPLLNPHRPSVSPKNASDLRQRASSSSTHRRLHVGDLDTREAAERACTSTRWHGNLAGRNATRFGRTDQGHSA